MSYQTQPMSISTSDTCELGKKKATLWTVLDLTFRNFRGKKLARYSFQKRKAFGIIPFHK